MRRTTPLAAVLAVLSWLLLLRPVAAEELRVGHIEIRTAPVFSAQEAGQGRFYRTLNDLHVPTRPDLLREFLLFAEGDPYVPSQLEESERNLRQLDFLKSATITPRPPHDGKVDIDVVTQDAWTTDPNGDFSHVRGLTVWQADVTQKNLFGSGAELSTTASRDVERTRKAVELSTPAFFEAYWNADALWAQSSDGRERRFSLGRSLASYSRRWTLAVDFDRRLQHTHLYDLGRQVTAFRESRREARIEGTYAFEASEARSRRLVAGLDLLDDSFRRLHGETFGPLPLARRFRTFFLGYVEGVNDFVKLDYVDQDSRVQDFQLGRQLDLRLGLSPQTLGAVRPTTLLHLAGSRGWRLRKDGFLLPRCRFETRASSGKLQNAFGSAGLLWVQKVPGPFLQTLVGRLDYTHGWRLDRDLQFYADGTTGLRAYPARAYAGDKRLLLNFEDRIFLGRELLQLFAPGAAVFVDIGGAGGAERPGTALELKNLKADIGAGLRFGIARADSTTLRFDLAYRLNQDATGRRGFVLSIGSTQAF